MFVAITRDVSPSVGQCELAYCQRVPIDLARAQQQHAAYVQALASLGVRVHSLIFQAEPEVAETP